MTDVLSRSLEFPCSLSNFLQVEKDTTKSKAKRLVVTLLLLLLLSSSLERFAPLQSIQNSISSLVSSYETTMLSVPQLPDSPPPQDNNDINMMQIAEIPTSFTLDGTGSGMSPANQPRTTPPPLYSPTPTPTSTPSKGIPSSRSATKRRELLQQKRHTPGFGFGYTSSSSSSRQTTTTNIPSKASAQRVRDQRLPTTKTSSVFDRLYKTPTAASKQWTSSSSSARKSQPRKTHLHSASSNLDDKDLQVFSRLHISGTVANTSKQKRQSKSTLTIQTTRSPTKSYSPKSPGVHTPTRSRGGALVYSPRMKPKTQLLYSSRYHPGLGMEDIQPIKLGYAFFQSFCEYEAGQMDARTLAQEMIHAFFKQDFKSKRCVLFYYYYVVCLLGCRC